jgi:hypothetical protein
MKHALFLLATVAAANAAPVIVYNFKLVGNQTTYFHNPLFALEFSAQKPLATQVILRDVATKRSVEIDTNVSGNQKFYRISVGRKSNGDVNWPNVVTTSYAERTRLLDTNIGGVFRGGVQVERISRFNPDTSNFLSFIVGTLSAIKVSPTITAVAPKTMTGTSHYWATEYLDDTGAGIPGQRYQINPETATFSYNTAYSAAVNVADPRDTATPTDITPGSLPYAAYRVVQRLAA